MGRGINRLIVVAPAREVRIGSPDEDPFIQVGKYYGDGTFSQPDIFVAEVPRARVHIGSGLVCTRGFEVLADSGRTDRLGAFTAFGRRRPLRVRKFSGAYSTLQYCYANNFWHWMVDCLPKLISLEKALPGQSLTLLMPETITPVQRESMLCVLPEHFTVSYLPADAWIETETFFWPSLASGRCNAMLPPGYFAEMRARVFARYGLGEALPRGRRLYLTRRNAKHRRVKNEDVVCSLLAEFDFEIVELEKLSFQEQVKLMHEASVVAGPHGAALASTVFSGAITLLVFYATPRPPNYFHTQSVALGQRHHFILDCGTDEDADFSVDPGELRRLLEAECWRL